MKTLIWLLGIASYSFANVIGSDAQNFAPTQDGLDFVTVHSSETLEPGIINFGFFLNHARNTFPSFEGEGNPQNRGLLNTNDSLNSADFNFAIGILKNWQVGMSFPYILSQSIDSTENLGRFEGSGTSEIRLATKYHLGMTEGWGFAVAGSVNSNRIDSNPYVGEGAGPTANLEFIVDKVFGRWNWAANFGHRWRSRGTPLADSGIDPLPNQWIGSTALSYLFRSVDTKLILEFYGSSPTESTENLSNQQNSSMEALVGAKHDLNQRLALHAGLGSEVGQGTSTPDSRIYLGLNYAVGPLFSKPEIQERITPEKEVNLTIPNLMFEFDKAVLIPQSQRIVDLIVERIRRIRAIKAIRIEGHTDSVGSEEYNQGLSQRRAETIAKLLIEQVPMKAEQVQALGKGELEPIADNGNYQGRQKNRRVEIYIEN